MTPLLAARDLAIAGRLESTSLIAEEGSLLALIGPNGSGKTSLLRAIAGIEPSSGVVTIEDHELWTAPPARRQLLLGYLPASRDVVWPINVRDLIALGLPTPQPQRIHELLRLLELDSLADRPVTRISTGERGRALLARALAARPRLLLLDEPMSNLDPYWVLRTIEIVRDELDANQSTAIISVHDLGQIERFDRILMMDGGRLIADGTAASVLSGRELASTFRIARAGGGWTISPTGDRQSLP